MHTFWTRFHRLTPMTGSAALVGLLVPATTAPASAQPAVQPASATAAPETWAFTPAPDTFSSEAVLDLRYLNEKVAGESGFVRVDTAGDFRLGNGKPVRFWAVNTNVGREKPWRSRPRWEQKTEPNLDTHGRFLAKRGVNMVRLHSHINPDLKANPNARLTDINTAERDWIWRTVAAMKKHGIYTTVSPYWANTMQFNPAWNLPGNPKDAHNLLFFDETLQGAYKQWLRALLTEKNPYTGIPLAQDPALAIIQLQNEDSLLFWTVNNLKGEHRKALGKRYGEWLTRKYGSLEKATAAWQGNKLPGDDPAAGIMDFQNIYEMTQNRNGGIARRLDDQLQFWSETMYNFNRDMAKFLREELGCKQVVNAGNWKTADVVRLNDAERWSYTANEVLAVNRYFGGLHTGPQRGWAVQGGDQFTRFSALHQPQSLPIALKQAQGKAMLVTESSWVMPNGYATEGPFLIAAYQSLTGVDAYYWFVTGDEAWTPPQSANGFLESQAKWPIGTPDVMGTFPAAVLMYRQGYIREGEPAVVEHRALSDLWQRRTPVIAETASFDAIRDAGNLAPSSSIRTPVPVEAFYVGPVVTVFGSDPAKSKAVDFQKYIDPKAGTVRSITGELTFNKDAGYCILDAPKAQGVAAHFANRREFSLSAVSLKSNNDYGTVLVVSMDDKPIRESRKLLVQVGTHSEPTGWKAAPTTIKVEEGSFDGFKVESVGGAPWQVAQPDVTISVQNPGLRKATILDANGMPTGTAPLTKTATGVSLTFPKNTLYVVLE
ncbi:MAG: hypothetical protein OHK0029_41390 [Armatimonadaceae bacterium]